jgi:uncharacterized iron-regulated protein
VIKYIFVILFVVLYTGCSLKKEQLSFNIEKKEEHLFSSKKAKEISYAELIDEIKEYKVVFVGDHHNTKASHEFFNEVLNKLISEGYNIHLANEWFYPSHNKLLEDYTKGVIDSKTLKEKREWEKFTKYKWEYVEKLYETVKKSNGKLYGINISKKERKKISLKQLSLMNAGEKIFYDNLDLDVQVHKDLVSPYFKHCNKMPIKSDEDCEKRMYRVQVTWDTYMAKQTNLLAKRVLNSPKDILLVFAGAMHVEKNLGIPLRFSRLNNTPFTTITNYRISKEENIKFPINKADIIYIYNKQNDK